MSVSVPTHYNQQYTSNVQLLVQQRGSKLRDCVSFGSYTGKAAKAVEQVGPVAARKRTTRHADTPLISTPAAARWVFPVDYEWADLIDDEDRVRMLIDPQSPYATNGAYSMGRAIDDEIIEALFAIAKTGENGSSNTAWDTNKLVAASVGSTTGMNHAKIRAALELLLAAEVDIDNDRLHIALAATQLMELFGETSTISMDYVDGKPVVTGKIPMLYGFTFHQIERLDVTSTERQCAAWAESGMHLGMWNDISTSISTRHDKSDATQVLVKGTFGATRTEEAKVIQIQCTES